MIPLLGRVVRLVVMLSTQEVWVLICVVVLELLVEQSGLVSLHPTISKQKSNQWKVKGFHLILVLSKQ